MSIDKTTVARVARLARLQVPEAELEKTASQLQGMLDWVEQLNEVNVDGVVPVASPHDMSLRWRADAVTDGNQQTAVLQNAPQSAAGFFVVPKVIE